MHKTLLKRGGKFVKVGMMTYLKFSGQRFNCGINKKRLPLYLYLLFLLLFPLPLLSRETLLFLNGYKPNYTSKRDVRSQRFGEKSQPSHTGSVFTRSPSTEGDRVYKLKICSFVCHHLQISNIGPLCHPTITPDPTYHILLGRG